MAVFEDLSPYEYIEATPGTLNVGWLGCGSPFETGRPESELVSQLLRIVAEEQVHITRGFHDCEFCEVESPVRVTLPETGQRVSLGMGEIHVTGVEGVSYAAPTLVVHYISAHGYRPPSEFVQAVHSWRPSLPPGAP